MKKRIIVSMLAIMVMASCSKRVYYLSSHVVTQKGTFDFTQNARVFVPPDGFGGQEFYQFYISIDSLKGRRSNNMVYVTKEAGDYILAENAKNRKDKKIGIAEAGWMKWEDNTWKPVRPFEDGVDPIKHRVMLLVYRFEEIYCDGPECVPRSVFRSGTAPVYRPLPELRQQQPAVRFEEETGY